MSRKLARYAIDLAYKAVSISRRQDRPKDKLDAVVDALRYEAIDTAFTVLMDVVAFNPPPHDHGMRLLTNLQRPSQTLVFDNGQKVERVVIDGVISYQMEVAEEPPENGLLLVDTLMTQLDDLLMIGDLEFGGNPLRLLRENEQVIIAGKGGRAAIGDGGYYTTNERIALAVQAGHGESVMEYIRIHNNGDDTDLHAVDLVDHLGVVFTWNKVPSYGLSAIDSYLTHLGIALHK